MADRFYAWNRVGGLPIIANSVRFKDKKGIQTITPGDALRAAITMTPQLASFD